MITPEAPTPEKRVLIVDDSKSIRTLFKIYLKRLPLRLEFAADGLAAIESVKNHPPDLILLDLMMPRMNGLELIGFLDQDTETRKIPRIVISAHDDLESLEELSRGNVTARIKKPVSMEALRPLLLEALEFGMFQNPRSSQA